jgi:dTMP kinase
MYIVALEGIDKAGKETQAELLAKALSERGFNVLQDGFPRYDTPVGKMIQKVLHNELQMSDIEFAKLYEIDRYQALEQWLAVAEEQEIDVLILDRWVMSNMVFQRAKGLSEVEILWLQHGLLPADLHIVVDITVEESLRRGQAYEVLDKNEKDTTLLENVRRLQLEYAEEGTYYGTGKVVRVSGEQDQRFVHRDILKEVLAVVGQPKVPVL